MKFEKGNVVRSKAGRDAGKFLMVVDVNDKGVLVCDGKERPLERPKLKNVRHLAPTNHCLQSDSMVSNRSLRKALKSFNEAVSSEEV